MRGGLIVCVLAACDPLADSRYVGDPLFTLVGTVSTGSSDAVGGVALMWQDTAGAAGPGVAATTVPVSLEFPTTFRVSVPLPPPDVARFAFGDGDVELAEAYVFIVAEHDAAHPTARGLDRGHALIWASADVFAGSLAADYLGGPVTAGYHLRRFVFVSEPALAQRTMIERCAVASPATACSTRRGYALVAAADDEQLRIVVSAR
jgi:hypothetical protein